MGTIETAGECIANAVLADLTEQLGVLQRDREQRGGGTQHAALMIGQRRFRRDTKHAFRHAADDHRKTHFCRRRTDDWIGFAEGTAGGALTIGGHRFTHGRLRFPLAGACARHNPHTAPGGEQRQVRMVHAANRIRRFGIHRASQRVAKRDEARHLRSALGGVLRSAGHAQGFSADLLALAELMEAEDRGEDHQRGKQVQSSRGLNFSHVVQQVRDRAGKDHKQRNRQPEHQDGVVAPHYSHGILTYLSTGMTLNAESQRSSANC